MYEEFTKAATLAIMFFMLVMISSMVGTFFMGSNFNFADSLFEAASAQGTVGLSAGITDPSMSPVLESIYIFQMWAGRLEIITCFGIDSGHILGNNSKNFINFNIK